MDIVKSELLSQFPEIVHGFSTKEWGNMSYRRDFDGKAERNNRAFLASLRIDRESVPTLDPCLNHGNTVAWLKSRMIGYRLVKLNDAEVRLFSMREPFVEPDGTVCRPDEGIDACWTDEVGACLSMRPADCAIIMLYDPKTHILGMIHAGTVGVLSDIVTHAIESVARMREVKPANLHCFVGPSISAVGYDLRRSGLWQRGLHRRMSEEQARDYNPKETIRRQLLKCGVPSKQIEVHADCTASNPDRYFSNRTTKTPQERATLGRMLAVIGLRR